MNKSLLLGSSLLLSLAAGCASTKPQPVVVEQAVVVDTDDPSFHPVEESGMKLDESKLDSGRSRSKAKRADASTAKPASMQMPGHTRTTGSVHAAR